MRMPIDHSGDKCRACGGSLDMLVPGYGFLKERRRHRIEDCFAYLHSCIDRAKQDAQTNLHCFHCSLQDHRPGPAAPEASPSRRRRGSGSKA